MFKIFQNLVQILIFVNKSLRRRYRVLNQTSFAFSTFPEPLEPFFANFRIILDHCALPIRFPLPVPDRGLGEPARPLTGLRSGEANS